MSVSLKAGLFVLMLVAAPVAAQAGTLEGAAIGAGSGALIAGPPGAVVGGVVGAVVGGPDVVTHRRHDSRGYRHNSRGHYARSNRHCWRDRYGDRHCSWR